MRVLIAEDDPTSHRILATVLTKAGHDVVPCTDGEQALTALRGPDAPSLAILDWMMPEMDGVDVVRELRAKEEGRRTYIVLLTAKGQEEDVVTGLDAGADDYITKPFARNELQARIRAGERILDLQAKLRARVDELQRAFDEIETLKGLLPMCASCKRIRDDEGFWQEVEGYLMSHSEASFSHGLCPECISKHYPEYERIKKKRERLDGHGD